MCIRDSIKTRSGHQDFGSSCRAVLEICDSRGNCCQTSEDGRGLYPGQPRKSGETNVYTNRTILGNCAQEVHNLHFDPNTRFPETQPNILLLKYVSVLPILVPKTVISTVRCSYNRYIQRSNPIHPHIALSVLYHSMVT